MVFLVLMAGETGVTDSDLPCMRRMACVARERGVSTILMQSFGTGVAGLATYDGMSFSFP
jgi:hypothetical protein